MDVRLGLYRDNTGYTNEGVKTDIGGVETRQNRNVDIRGRLRQCWILYETAAKLEAKVREDEYQQKVNHG